MSFVRRLLWKSFRWLLFRLDAETAHRLAVACARVAGGVAGGAPLRALTGAPKLQPREAAIQVCGLTFASRLGLAAGFDKNAELLRALPSLGFGFAEIGTVTPRPQPGNDRPRLFRDPARRALFNRMGFNNLGASVVSERVRSARPMLPESFRIGINIGKNKDTPLELAASDYALALAPFEGLADYLVINVSSPNTPGLRALQAVEQLKPVVEAVLGKSGRWRVTPPVFLKLAPEIRGDELGQILTESGRWGLAGFVLTNTLAGDRAGETGGWSGGPLMEESAARLREARSVTRLPIISVGGILDAAEAEARVLAGADLVQLYTGWIYGGPTLPAEIGRKLACLNR